MRNEAKFGSSRSVPFVYTFPAIISCGRENVEWKTWMGKLGRENTEANTWDSKEGKKRKGEHGISKKEEAHPPLHHHFHSLFSLSPLNLVFDVQLPIWRLRSCSTDVVKNALLISHFIKFNPQFFFKKN